MQIHFSAGEQPRWAWTDGLFDAGQQDIALPLPWPLDDWRDRQAANLLGFIGTYVNGQSRRILAGQTLRYGWTLLRFRESAPEDREAIAGRLVIQELRDPLHDTEPAFEDGARRAVELVAAQGNVFAHYHITADAEYPFRSQFVLLCDRVPPLASTFPQPLYAERLWEPDAEDSGWFVACTDPDHNHDSANTLGRVHLLHLVERFPHIFPYLALPTASTLVFDGDTSAVYLPGADEGYEDDTDPFTGIE